MNKILLLITICLTTIFANTEREADSLALVAIQENNSLLIQWNLTKPLDDWERVTLTNGRVTALHIFGIGIGKLPKEIGNLTELDTLNIGSNGSNVLYSLPDEFVQLQKLKYLSLDGNNLLYFPPEIYSLSSLEYLNVSRNPFREIDSRIADLVHLKKVNLGETNITSLPDEIGQLAKLEALYLNGDTLLTALPQALENCTALSVISAQNCQLSALPDFFSSFSNLTTLVVDTNSISALPQSLLNHSGIEKLSLARNKFSELPSEISNMVNLKELILSYNQLVTVPVELFSLSKLWYLGLNSNKLIEIPAEIAQLSELTHLYLKGNKLTTLPDAIGSLPKLEFLFAGWNDIVTVPETIGSLTTLTSLNLMLNELTVLPATIGKLQALISLDVSGNKLSGIPKEVSHLTSLTNISLSSNSIELLPDELFTMTNEKMSLSISSNKMHFDMLERLKVLDDRTQWTVSSYNQKELGEEEEIELTENLKIGVAIRGSQNKYQWYKGEKKDTLAIAGATDDSLLVTEKGIYTCIIRSDSLPKVTLKHAPITVNANTAILNSGISSMHEKGILVYPTIVTNKNSGVHFSIGQKCHGVVSITIYDALGEVIDEGIMGSGGGTVFVWDLTNLDGKAVGSGTYVAFAKIVGSDGTEYVAKELIGVQR